MAKIRDRIRHSEEEIRFSRISCDRVQGAVRSVLAGWSPQKCIALIRELSDLTANGLMHGAVLSVRNAEYDTYYRNNDGSRRLRLDTCYGLSFRLCVVYMIGEVIRRLGHDKRIDRTRLNIVLESGHRHSGDAARVFHTDPKPGWGATTNGLSAIIKKGHEAKPPFEREHFGFLEQMFETVEGLKYAWRNKISHAHGKLTLLTSDF
jgi:hypothetical protein